jgi:hypothetical protein
MMRGHLWLHKKNVKTGEMEKVDLGENLVVDAAYRQLAGMIARDPHQRYIEYMQFGTGTDPATAADTDLQSPLPSTVTISAAKYAFPSTYECEITCVLNANEGNGFSLSEAALKATSGVMWARRVFSPQAKTSDYIFTFVWSITS